MFLLRASFLSISYKKVSLSSFLPLLASTRIFCMYLVCFHSHLCLILSAGLCPYYPYKYLSVRHIKLHSVKFLVFLCLCMLLLVPVCMCIHLCVSHLCVSSLTVEALVCVLFFLACTVFCMLLCLSPSLSRSFFFHAPDRYDNVALFSDQFHVPYEQK